eukprot:scaffold5624_cov18-Tisochrysis_lutea.AAC.1
MLSDCPPCRYPIFFPDTDEDESWGHPVLGISSSASSFKKRPSKDTLQASSIHFKDIRKQASKTWMLVFGQQ